MIELHAGSLLVGVAFGALGMFLSLSVLALESAAKEFKAKREAAGE